MNDTNRHNKSNDSIRHPRTRFRQAAELLALSMPLKYPADSVIDRYFKAHKEMGSKDRAFAAETVYGCLRRLRELKAIVAPLIDGQVIDRQAPYIVAAYLLVAEGWQHRSLSETEVAPEADVSVKQVRQFDRASLSAADLANLSDTVYEALTPHFSDAEILDLAKALNQPAPVDLRINTGKTHRDSVQQALLDEGFDAEPTPFSPWGLRRETRGPLFNTRAFKQGQFELQDEASQLVSWLVAPKPRETIIDYCAGAGGKSLHLSQLMRNRGSVVSCDINAYRLDQMKPRLKRAGCDNVRLHAFASEQEDGLDEFIGKADAVLVDAPCSGTGTYRRNPDLKWRELDLNELNRLQLSILTAASKHVKPNGRLVYATCSVLPCENEAIIDAFLAANSQFAKAPPEASYENSLEILAAIKAVDSESSTLLSEFGTLRLHPHKHNTDGFFAQRLTHKTA